MEANAATRSEQIRVLVADDSPTVRLMICKMLETDPAIRIVGTAGDGSEAIEQAARHKPDLVTMDVQMPVMNGIDAIERIMAENPVPILVVSSVVDRRHTANAARALGAGAVDVMSKPTPTTTGEFEVAARDLHAKIRMLAKARAVGNPQVSVARYPLPNHFAPAGNQKRTGGQKTFRIVAVGSSTGGPQALNNILSNMPADINAAILVVQHIANGFSDGLIDWLASGSALRIGAGVDGQVIEPGKVILAPESRHMIVDKDKKIRLVDHDYPGPHKPSVNVLMDSVASMYGSDAIGVILTGMGNDGALGIKALHESGGHTIAQDSETSAIFGMAREAIKLGGVDEVLPLPEITDAIVKYLYRRF